MKTTYSSCLLAILPFLFVNCSTPVRPYRNYIAPEYWTWSQTGPFETNRAPELPVIDRMRASIIETNGNNGKFKLGFVEFDEQGWFWSFHAWQALKNEIESDATNGARGLAMVVFVHGWKNNAQYDNDNVRMFRGVLTNLSAILPRKVFGVYVGWRGLSIERDTLPVPAGKELSFYGRKAVAERIGHQGAATQVFAELSAMQEDLNGRSNNVPRTELFVIGHSFGAQILYSAISQVLTERLIAATRHHEPLKSFGDLVVLVNPAFEASIYNNLVSLATSSDIHYPTNQRPVLAIFESKGDIYNKFWFPVGRRLSTWSEIPRPSKGAAEEWLFNVRKGETADEGRAIATAVGFDQDFITYDLNYKTNEVGPSPVGGLETALSANNTVVRAADMASYNFDYTNYACVLQPRTNAYARYSYKRGNPFLNVAVDPNILSGHTDISNPKFLAFLRDLILFASTNSPGENGDRRGAPPK